MPVLYIGISPNLNSTCARGHGDCCRLWDVEGGSGCCVQVLPRKIRVLRSAGLPSYTSPLARTPVITQGALPTRTLSLAPGIMDYDMMRPMAIAACLVLSLAALSASAQETTGSTTAAPAVVAPAGPAAMTSVQGDPESGRLLTYTCRGCHGVEGYRNAYPNFQVPLIGGQSAIYLANALNEYRSGARIHPTMQAQAQSFSEQDIADIAAFLSNVK